MFIEFDFVSGNTTVTFGPTDINANFTITINDDNRLETTEQFNLTLLIPDVTKAVGVEEGAPVVATGRIMNDDSKEHIIINDSYHINDMCAVNRSAN